MFWRLIDRKRVGEYWSNSEAMTAARRWQDEQIYKHSNVRMCGRPLRGKHAGMLAEIARLYPGRTFERGVSIGAGFATLEMAMLKTGLVQHFTIYELSEKNIADAEAKAARDGLAERMTFVSGDAFAAPRARYDMVNWKGALHHMPDTRAAVKWSFDALNPGGLFVMDEYTGPNRLQYTKQQLKLGTEVLATLPDKYFASAADRKCEAPSKSALIKKDPSEAIDSAYILPAANKTFPDAHMVSLGGLVHFIALRKILSRFSPDDPDDAALFARLLVLDGEYADRGESVAHAAIAQKPA